MTWQPTDIIALIGAITGVLSIVGLVYAFGVKFGSIETRITGIEGNLISREAFGELRSKVGTLYKIYVEEAIPMPRRRRIGGNPGHHSNPGGSEEKPTITLTQDFIEEIRKVREENPEAEVVEIVSLVFERLAGTKPKQLMSFIKENDITPKDLTLAIWEEVKKIKGEPL